jgi:hypothetical protein
MIAALAVTGSVALSAAPVVEFTLSFCSLAVLLDLAVGLLLFLFALLG